jgi:hypothetical protein
MGQCRVYSGCSIESANERCAAGVLEAFTTGPSPGDFPEDHYEHDWSGRFTPDRLNSVGRRGLGLGLS